MTGELERARTAAATLLAVPIFLTVVAGLVARPAGLGFLAPPAGVLGLLGPVAGFRLYRRALERIPRGAAPDERARRFTEATRSSFLGGGLPAVAGVVVYSLSARPVALTGTLMLTLLAGAVWPTRERLEAFLEAGYAGEES